jgi:hypothetical protein
MEFAIRGSSTPSITIESDVISLGDIDTTEPVRKSAWVSIRNNSRFQETVFLKPDCGCMVTETSIELSSYASQKFEVQIEVAPRPGPFNKSLVATLKDGTIVKKISLAGTVLPNAQLVSVPSSLNFGVLKVGKVRTFRLFRFDASSVKIDSISCPDGFEARIGTSSSESTLNVEIECLVEKVNSNGEASIELFTSHPLFGRIKIPLQFASSTGQLN